MGSTVRRFGHLRYVIQQRTFRLVELSFIQLSLSQRLYRLLFCSLNPQEVSMRVQSIRTSVEIGNPAGNSFLLASAQVSLGKMDCVAKLQDIAKEIRSVAEAFQNPRHLLSARLLAPFVVDGSHVASGIGVLNQPDLGLVLSHNCKFA